MPQSLSKIIIHLVFSTKNRFPFLSDADIRRELHAYLGGACNHLGCQTIIVGGTADHVHILFRLSRNLSISTVAAEIKRESSKWIKSKSRILTRFAWQNGYGAFSVGQRDIERVRTYILGQVEHHRHRSFQKEYRVFLRKYDLEFDEKYVWD